MSPGTYTEFVSNLTWPGAFVTVVLIIAAAVVVIMLAREFMR